MFELTIKIQLSWSFWKPFLMIFLSLPSSEGTGLRLCPQTPPVSECRECREGAPCSGWVSVSAARKLEEGSIRDIKTDVTLAPGPVGTQGLTLKQKKWYQWMNPKAALEFGNIGELRLWVCEVTWQSQHPYHALRWLMARIMMWRILLSSVQISMFIWLTGLWQSYG